MTVKATANCNFAQLGGTDPHDRADRRYAEYRTEWEERPKRFDPGNFPVHLDLEASSRCNLRCVFCDKLPVLDSGQLGDMDLALFKRIVDEGMENGLYSLKLSYRGEPLMNPDLPAMVAYAKQRGIIDVYFNTNGMLLTEGKARQLIDAGLDRISFSVEGTEPEPFEAARIGAKFSRIKANIRRLKELRDAGDGRHPRIRIQTVDLPHVDLKQYADYWSELADETAVIDYKEADNPTDDGQPAPGWGCPQPWQRMTIEWDGTMHPCNNDDQGNAVLGNAGTASVAGAWRSGRAEELRRLHVEGRSHEDAACKVCPWRTTQVLKFLQGKDG